MCFLSISSIVILYTKQHLYILYCSFSCFFYINNRLTGCFFESKGLTKVKFLVCLQNLANKADSDSEFSSDSFKAFWRLFQADGAAFLKAFIPSSACALGTRKMHRVDLEHITPRAPIPFSGLPPHHSFNPL